MEAFLDCAVNHLHLTTTMSFIGSEYDTMNILCLLYLQLVSVNLYGHHRTIIIRRELKLSQIALALLQMWCVV